MTGSKYLLEANGTRVLVDGGLSQAGCWREGRAMDVGTSLVQAYLHMNSDFTATDYPLVEPLRDEMPRTITDIDMLAVRFGHDPATEGRGRKPAEVRGP